MQADAINRSISTQNIESSCSENLCLYCADSWHHAVNCPNNVKRTIAVTAVLVPEQINVFAQFISPLIYEEYKVNSLLSHFFHPY